MTDEFHEGVYTWASDGSVAATYTRKIGGVPFADGQPDNLHMGHIAHCAAISWDHLEDYDCGYSVAYGICELPGK